ncbi:hypothetical protein G6F31_017304 [Rhizopus arrhizus]|nr:hypothetical protein G6F31_017304 [Rhizopus arrhizus]
MRRPCRAWRRCPSWRRRPEPAFAFIVPTSLPLHIPGVIHATQNLRHPDRRRRVVHAGLRARRQDGELRHHLDRVVDQPEVRLAARHRRPEPRHRRAGQALLRVGLRRHH